MVASALSSVRKVNEVKSEQSAVAGKERPERPKAISPGQRPGYFVMRSQRPAGVKAFLCGCCSISMTHSPLDSSTQGDAPGIMLLPFQGAFTPQYLYPGRSCVPSVASDQRSSGPGLTAFGLSDRFLGSMR